MGQLRHERWCQPPGEQVEKQRERCAVERCGDALLSGLAHALRGGGFALLCNMSQLANTTVRSVMSSPVVLIDADAPLKRAFAELRTHHISHLCVTEAGRVIGIVSDRDLYRAMPSALGATEHDYESALADFHVKQVMTRVVLTIDANARLTEAMRQLATNSVHALLVADAGRAVGILTTTDCLKLAANDDTHAAW